MPRTVTRGLIMPKARGHTLLRATTRLVTGPRPPATAKPLTVVRRNHSAPTRRRRDGFRFSFTPLIGVLFVVQSPYYALSVAGSYLALEGGPPEFTPGSTCPALLGKSLGRGEPRYHARTRCRLQGCHLLRRAVPGTSPNGPFVTPVRDTWTRTALPRPPWRNAHVLGTP